MGPIARLARALAPLVLLACLLACAFATPPARSPFFDCLVRASSRPPHPPPTSEGEANASVREDFAQCSLCGVRGAVCPPQCSKAPCSARIFDARCRAAPGAFGGEQVGVPKQFLPGAPYFYCVVGLFLERMQQCRWGFCPQHCALCGVYEYGCPLLCRGVGKKWKPFWKK